MSLLYLQREQCALMAAVQQHQGPSSSGTSAGLLFQSKTDAKVEKSLAEQSSSTEEDPTTDTLVFEAEKTYKKIAHRIKRKERKLVRLLRPKLPREFFFHPEPAVGTEEQPFTSNSQRLECSQLPKQQATSNGANFFSFGNLLTLSREKLLAVHLLEGPLPSIPEVEEEEEDCDSSSTRDEKESVVPNLLKSDESPSLDENDSGETSTSDISWTTSSSSSLDASEEEEEPSSTTSCSTCRPLHPQSLSVFEQDEIKRTLFMGSPFTKQPFGPQERSSGETTNAIYHYFFALRKPAVSSSFRKTSIVPPVLLLVLVVLLFVLICCWWLDRPRPMIHLWLLVLPFEDILDRILSNYILTEK